MVILQLKALIFLELKLMQLDNKLIIFPHINKEPILKAGVFVFYQYLNLKKLAVFHKNNIKAHAIAVNIGEAE